MALAQTIRGADIKLFISGKIYPEVQSLQYTIDYGEHEIYGIDSPYAQEIAHTKISVQGSITGIRIKMSGGLQGAGAREKIHNIIHAPYVSLEIRDRQNNSKLLWLPQMKVTSESFSVSAKGSVKLSFKFKGIIPFNELDMA